MTLFEAVFACVSKYATFSGRARRSEFWMANLAFFLALMAWGMIAMFLRWEILRFLGTLFFLACLLPLLAVSVRRLHDVGRSGLWLLIGFVPFGGIVTFVFACIDSEPYTNQYGPPPKPIPYYYQPGVSPYPAGMAPLPSTPEPVDESELPFYQARRRTALEASGRQRYESGEPGLDSQKVEAYFAKSTEQKPIPTKEPKIPFSFSTMSRKTLGIAGGGFFLLVLIIGIFLGQNSWRPSVQDSVQAAGSLPQPAAPAPAPQTYSPPTQANPSPPPTAQAAAAAPATIPTATFPAQPQPVVQPTPAAALPAGDLGLTTPLRPVGCTGQYIVVYHSSTDPSVYAQDIQTNLQSHPGSKYLLTLDSCSSLNRMSKAGTMIYTVYGGPYNTLAQACVAASRYPDESYVKIMDAGTAPDQAIQTCQ